MKRQMWGPFQNATDMIKQKLRVGKRPSQA